MKQESRRQHCNQDCNTITLADWRKARKYAKKHTVVLTENEANAKICELERENAELRQANEILKDALGFFAKDRKK